MGQTCTKCSRVNPEGAAYCYHDGAVLAGHRRDGGPVAVGSQPFASPFVFPSGRQCRSFDELAMACQTDWAAARDLLAQGFFEGFLGGLGRADLARAAREAAHFPDHDRGLDQLLGQLPGNVVEPPRLFVAPQEVSLGTLKVGQDQHCELHLENRGMRLLYGSVTCDGCDWLALGDAPGGPEKFFQFGAEALIPVHVKGKLLRAGNKPLEGRLVVESNGGNVNVTVRAEVPPKPFPDGVLKGALSPRQAAEKAKAAPKEAAASFEKGAVADWYKSNGWTYPVSGPSASGLGAVQQFFEALGLTPPPKVHVSERAVTLEATAGASIRHVLEVKSEEKRPVYAHATSNAAWLEVGRPKLNGRVATIPLVVPNVPDRAGETLTAKVTVQANGNQRFVVPVTLVIGGSFVFDDPAPAKAARATAETAVATAPPPKVKAAPAKAVAMPAPGKERVIDLEKVGRARPGFSPAHLLPPALLALVLIGVLAVDWFRGQREPAVNENSTGALNFDAPYPEGLKSYEPWLGIDFDDRMRFGIVVKTERDPKNAEKFKRLTFREKGSTNNTCVKVDGNEYLFGNAPGHGKWVKKRRKAGRVGWDSVFLFDKEDVEVTQSVDLVPGEQTLLLDTVLVRYKVENKSKLPHNVGLRMMLDTFIGANDGVPFAVPATEGGKDRVVKTKEVLEQKEVARFIQALERDDLKDPGTVAQLGLEIDPKRFEALHKLIISAWPGNKEMRWEINPLNDMNSNPDFPDSCVTLYWAYQEMNPGEVREMAFTYGLGTISSTGGLGEGGNAGLGLTVGGGVRPGRDFTVSAWVKGPQDGQVATLTLPEGFSFAPGNEAAKPIAGGGERGTVSWNVRAPGKEGEYALEAASGGLRTSLTIRVRAVGVY